jgi:hypothetical protein
MPTSHVYQMIPFLAPSNPETKDLSYNTGESWCMLEKVEGNVRRVVCM